MKNRLGILFALLALMGGTAAAQDARTVLQAAATAMGAANLKSVQYSGTGWFGAVGQSYSPDLDWPRTDVKSYTRTIDYDAKSSNEEMVRVQGSNPLRGGGQGFPIQTEIRQGAMVSGNYAWNMQGNNATPAPAAAEVRQLDIWLTPHGFLKAAMAGNATAISRMEAGRNVTIVSFTALGKYRVNGTINDENLVQLVRTWVPNPVFGDMLYETRYTNYKDFGGVKFPTVLHSHQGDLRVSAGGNYLEVRVSNFQANGSGAALSVPDAVRQATAPPVRVESQKLAEGVWLLAGGSHNSMAVEFRDFVAVVEAPLNEERSLAVIAEVRKLIPSKPIRYVVNTHHHFDHSGGLRTYVAEGATIVTHQRNREFFEKVAFSPAPRPLQPDRLALFPMTPTFETVTQKYVLSDGARTMDIYFVQGLDHNANMLLPYLPQEKIVVNADLYSPPTPNAPAPATPSANSLVFYENIKRLKLEVAQIAPIHGRVGTMDEFLKVVGKAE